MVFSSLEFIFVFLPLFFLVYFLVPTRGRNLVLLVFSIIFYFYGTWNHPTYLLVFLLSMIINYILGIGIQKRNGFQKTLLVLGLILNFSCLIVFKYARFLLEQTDALFSVPESAYSLPIFNLMLPIGISFYTFQAVSYLIDVYRGDIECEYSILDFGTYICMFPQLIAGPIVTYSEVREALKARICNIYTMSDGMKTFIFGLGIKVIIANRCGSIWTAVENIGFESISTPFAWLSLLARTFQIYFDFFGYSLMAVGLGQMLGFHFPANFNHPYLTLTMTDFWRKWHITLGRWFREYLYIPLGGNRNGEFATCRNLFIVWIFTGLWHGAALNFLLWGLVLFIFIFLEKIILAKYLNKTKFLGALYMLFLVPMTWVLFSITDFNQIVIFYKKLFPFLGTVEAAVFADDYLKYLQQGWIFLLLGIVFSTKIPYRIYSKAKNSILCSAVLLLVFTYSVYSLYMGLNDPFLYFRF